MPISSLIIRTDKKQTQAVMESLKHCPDASSVEVLKKILLSSPKLLIKIDKALWEEIENPRRFTMRFDLS